MKNQHTKPYAIIQHETYKTLSKRLIDISYPYRKGKKKGKAHFVIKMH